MMIDKGIFLAWKLLFVKMRKQRNMFVEKKVTFNHNRTYTSEWSKAIFGPKKSL